MEDGQGRGILVHPEALANRVAAAGLPRLVLLASCYSAAEPQVVSDVAPAALAPHLIRAGTPVVVGMNGPIALDAARQFFAHFTKALRRDPDVEKAATEARRQLNNQSQQWSVPVLFTALADGDVRWSPASFKGPPKIEFPDWELLMRSIRHQECVVVLGPAVTDDARREGQEIVRTLVIRHEFPLKRQERSVVTSFVGTTVGRSELLKNLEGEFRQLAYATAANSGLVLDPASRLPDAMTALARHRSEQDQDDLLRVVSHLRQPLYITTDPFDTLEVLLRERDCEPISDYPRWKESLISPAALPAASWDEDPSRPLVYHLFGRWSEPNSLVITESDLLDFLLAVRDRTVLPVTIQARLRRSNLLFAGFPLEDFDSHVVFKTLVPSPSRGAQRQRVHVSANAYPDDLWTDHSERARGYFDAYFGEASVSIHWGTVQEFATGIRTRLDEVQS
jgi:hypothetical protein